MKKQEESLALAPQAYAILVALAGNERHGYEIMKFVEEDLGQDVPTATLYRHIRYLVENGMIAVDEQKTAASDDPRRRYYKLTGIGQRALVAETERMDVMLHEAKRRIGGLHPAFQLEGM